VVVRGGEQRGRRAVAHAVADSPLVKTALYGGDPNWGRIIQAVGAALPGTAPLAVDIAIEGVPVCAPAASSRSTRRRSRAPWRATRSSTRSDLPGEGAETELFFSDLGHEYVTINADYTT
jgi:glutamate N-acetyltransferase/amino-acid N-acetyltransferase